MNQIPDILYADQDLTTWLIVGASRGIGLEFVRQLLNRGERIIATVREPWAAHASALWGQAGSDHGKCQMYLLDILSEDSIIVCFSVIPIQLYFLLIFSIATSCDLANRPNPEIRRPNLCHPKPKDRLCCD